MYRYVAAKESLHSNELGKYKTYGIVIFYKLRKVGFVSDISQDRQFVKALCKKCTKEQLDPLHINCVIEDAFCKQIEKSLV